MNKHKFTWIDGLIIAVIVVLIAGSFVRFFVKDTTSAAQQTVPFTYQLKLSNVRGYTADSLQVGDTVYDNEGKGAVGVISDIHVEPAAITYTSLNGEILQTQAEDYYDITLTLSADGVAVDNTYKVGTYTLRINQKSIYFTKYSEWIAHIISID